MSSYYDAVNEVWVAEHNRHSMTVRGKNREAIQERLRETATRYEQLSEQIRDVY